MEYIDCYYNNLNAINTSMKPGTSENNDGNANYVSVDDSIAVFNLFDQADNLTKEVTIEKCYNWLKNKTTAKL